MPPAARVATVRGGLGAVDDVLTLVRLPEGGEVLGPAPWTESSGDDDVVQAVIRVPRSRGEELVTALGEVQRVRSARKLDPVRIQVDPPTL